MAAMRSEKPSIELFLSPAGAEGQSLARGLGEEALVEAAVDGDDHAHPHSHFDPGGDPNSLRDQGWGVIAPRGDDGDRLLARVRALIDQRAADQDGEVPVYRVPPDMTAAQSVAWIDRQLAGNAMNDAVPGYLLVLGRPDQISFELQQVLASAYHVGRVGFDAEAGGSASEGYEAYVDKLLRTERTPAAMPARAVYFTVRDGTPATELARRLLMHPCIADAEQQRAAGGFATSEIAPIEEEDPTRAADRLVAAAAGPGVLFSCSHGAGASRQGWGSSVEQRTLQGALCLGRGRLLEARMLARSPFVPGGVWLMFACFGAGTPAHSAYHPWLARLSQHGEHVDDLSSVLVSLPRAGEPAFVAALPQTALANPDGPLAVIGHLDLAWSYGFHDIDKMSRGERHRRFHELVSQLLRGSRVGLALSGSLARARNQIRTELVIAADAETRGGQMAPERRAQLAHRWMALQDLDGYIALGDPAARMAVYGASARAHRGAAADAKSIGPIHVTTRDAIASSATRDPLCTAVIDAAAAQAAVHDLIAGSATLAELAGRYGVDPATVAEWRRVYTDAGLRAVSELVAITHGR
jgi:hypothetical protein